MEKPWKVIVAFVGVFIAGAVFGGLLSLRVSKQRQIELQQATVAQLQAQLTQVAAVSVAPAPAPTATAPVQGDKPASQTAAVTPKPPQLQPQPLPVGMAVQVPALMRRYVDRLDLTPEQKERIHPVINRAGKDISRQQQTNLRETGIILQHLQEDISKELTPAQRKVIEEMTERQRLLIEQREKKQQELLRQQQAEKQDKRANTDKPAKENIKKPSGKPPEDGN